MPHSVLVTRKLPASVIARLEARKSPQPYLDVAAFQRLEAERKTIQTRTEELQARRNQLSKQIGQLKSKGESADAVMAEVAQCKVELDQSAARLEQIQPEMEALLLGIPNLPHESVPVGEDEKGNVEKRTVLRLSPRSAPVKVAVLPLLRNKEALVGRAKELYAKLKRKYAVFYDEAGAIGRRYRRQDEIGTPWCVTVDVDSLDDGAVTVRDRDTMSQERVPVENVRQVILDRMAAART